MEGLLLRGLWGWREGLGCRHIGRPGGVKDAPLAGRWLGIGG